MADYVDCAVIGAGVVGLAVARELALSGLETVVLESEARIGTGTSSRNSEVIHAGIYYQEGSLKARLCVEGRRLLYDYCASRGIAHRRCGKLIVATADAQRSRLAAIVAAAVGNGVTDLRMLERPEVRALEPALECVAAVLSPSTGIVDSHALMLGFQADFENAGGVTAFRTPVIGGKSLHDGILLQTGGGTDAELHARYVVNCAGLAAQAVVHSIDGVRPDAIPRLYLARGNYFSLTGRAPFRHLVYPVPEPGGLGIHLTLDQAGRARFGPDIEWVDGIDYSVDARRAHGFYAAIRRYWPALPDGALTPAYAGIRPKLAGPGAPNADFMIQDASQHGVSGLINLYGIESPGLTASLAIARLVREKLRLT
jgi:L-2-hydroxyglutarate oxidase LhgO